jgi:NAD(P)-dependent dehydrogenase (short-subunit alcohol dehydrogenase family)
MSDDGSFGKSGGSDGRGIGRGLAIGFGHAGYDVTITDLPSQARELTATKAAIEALGRKSWAETMDVSIKPEVDASLSRVLHNAGKIDVLVNNGGIPKPSTLEALSEKDWDAHMNVNVKGVLLCCQAVLPSMGRRKSGRIINIASIAGRQSVATQGHYAATKAAVITLTRVWRKRSEGTASM